MWAASHGWERLGKGSAPRPSRGNNPANTLTAAQTDFGWEIGNLGCSKSPSFWYFVVAAKYRRYPPFYNERNRLRDGK